MKNVKRNSRRGRSARFIATEGGAMKLNEITEVLGTTHQTVAELQKRALKKMRNRPVSYARFRDAVIEQRRALDARPGNGPWTDIDAGVDLE